MSHRDRWRGTYAQKIANTKALELVQLRNNEVFINVAGAKKELKTE